MVGGGGGIVIEGGIPAQTKKKRKSKYAVSKRDFFSKTKRKAKAESEEFRQIFKTTIPCLADNTDLLAASERIIQWSYDELHKYERRIPDYLKHGLDSSTLSGVLWKLKPGSKHRPRLPPDPFALIYSRWLIHDAEQHTVLLTREGRRVLPAPPLDEGTLRWIVIRDGEIDYHIRPRIPVTIFNCSTMNVTPDGLCVMPQPYDEDDYQ